MSGPGTELKKILSWFSSAETCQNCADKAKIMDDKGVEWVEENIETVVRWVVANSKRMKVSRFIPEALAEAAAKQLILLACSNSKKTKPEDENNTGEDNEQTQATDNTDVPSAGDGLRPAAQRSGEEQPADSGEAGSQPAATDADEELGEQAPVEDGAR